MKKNIPIIIDWLIKIFLVWLLVQFFLQTFVTFKLWWDWWIWKIIWLWKEIIILLFILIVGSWIFVAIKNKGFKGAVEIDNALTSGGYLGTGKKEKIYTNSDTKSALNMSSWINSVKSNVASWLNSSANTTGYDNTADIFNNCKDSKVISSLVAAYAKSVYNG